MAQRKGQSKQRRRRRRARQSGTPAVLILLCLLVGAVAIITAMTIFFKVQRITLTGETRYSESYVAQASGLEIGDNLVLIEKFTVIDQYVVWYGSVNFLSFGTHEESIMRFENSDIAGQLTDTVLCC